MSWTWRGKGFLCHSTGYKTEQQKRIEGMSDKEKIYNRIDNAIKQLSYNIKDGYHRKLYNRAINNMSPIVWMPFKDYFRAEIEDRLDRTGVNIDQQWIHDYIDSRCNIYYKEWAEREVKGALEYKKRKLISNAKGFHGDPSAGASIMSRESQKNPEASRHHW